MVAPIKMVIRKEKFPTLSDFRSYLIAGNVEAGLGVAEITDGWHFLHAGVVIGGLGLDVQLEVNLPVAFVAFRVVRPAVVGRARRVGAHAVVVVLDRHLVHGVVVIGHHGHVLGLMVHVVHGLGHHHAEGRGLLAVEVVGGRGHDRAPWVLPG